MTTLDRNLVDAMAKEFDTHGKAFMFLKMEFRRCLPNINLEGSPNQRAFNIWDQLNKQGEIRNLRLVLYNKLDIQTDE